MIADDDTISIPARNSPSRADQPSPTLTMRYCHGYGKPLSTCLPCHMEREDILARMTARHDDSVRPDPTPIYRPFDLQAWGRSPALVTAEENPHVGRVVVSSDDRYRK